ncbi:porin [Pontibacterium granulatum]|uniref:porin n=1 Tax=Pontibacterium granulatum TaxID=2036029 RepID=UPI00249A492C|nr:porin [Pontibacterium granulatum]MDI3324431.1 porin [Pontibacterium granulatum]
MKKSIIALAVAGALVAPLAQADATLYGSLRLKVQSLDGANELNVTDNSSRIGIKGSTELFSGAKGIFQFEQAVSTVDGAFSSGRLASAGITGDFGTVNAGRQWSPFATWTLFPTDIVDNRTSGASGYQPGLHRLANTVAYVSPNMSGFQAAAVIIAANNADGEDLDAYNLAAKYAMGGLTVAASTVGLEAANQDVNSLAVSYEADALYVAARYQDDETAGAGQEDSYEVAGSYTMGNTKVLANFVDSDDDAVGEQWSLEVQQKLGKKARMFAAYTSSDSVDDGDVDGVEVGYRVDF